MKLNLKIKRGACRTVLLIGRWAVKVPRCTHWRSFVWGLLSNDLERVFWTTKDPRLCPVLFSIPLGFLVVMPRCTVMDSENWIEENVYDFIRGTDETFPIPAEPKYDSFGYLDNNFVCIDYGGPYWYQESSNGRAIKVWLGSQGETQNIPKNIP